MKENQIKTCNKCKEDKQATLENFHKKKNGKYGLDGTCKICKNKNSGYRYWSKEEVLEEFYKYVNNGGNIISLGANDKVLHTHISRKFNSYKDFLEMLGYDYDKLKENNIKWNKTYIQKEFDLFLENNPNGVINKDYIELYTAIQRRYGSLKNFLMEQEIDYENFVGRKQWSDERIISEIRNHYDKDKMSIVATNIQKIDKTLYTQSRKYFETWENAVINAGIDYESLLSRNKWDKDKIKNIINSYRHDDISLRQDKMRKLNSGIVYAAVRLFGSWKEAVIASGYDYPYFDYEDGLREKNLQRLKTLYRDEWKLKEEKHYFLTDRTTFIHLKCGNEKEFRVDFFLNEKVNKRCTYCNSIGIKRPDLIKNFPDELNSLSPYEVTPSSSQEVWWQCEIDRSHYWLSSPRMVTRNVSICPYCKLSKGERAIWILLKKYDINFTNQQSFPDCKNVNSLCFDFAVFLNQEIKLLIEYDGEQHFKPIKGWGGQEYYEYMKENDRIKDDYCDSKNIPLLRIPYWDYDDLTEIVINKLIENGIINKELKGE